MTMMIWIILYSILLGVVLFKLVMDYRASKRIKKEMEKFNEIADSNNGLFHAHFQTTDQTILDTRKERDYWKAKYEATQSE